MTISSTRLAAVECYNYTILLRGISSLWLKRGTVDENNETEKECIKMVRETILMHSFSVSSLNPQYTTATFVERHSRTRSMAISLRRPIVLRTTYTV